jgi:uncharacterized Zn-binding protein involved in type VI secretion
MPLSAPLTSGLATSVLACGSPLAVAGSSGLNTPPHPGLDPSDPKFTPSTQKAEVAVGSSTVTAEGSSAAYTGCTVTGCLAPAPQVLGSATTVMIGS